jgi:hypothetical protein
MSRLNGVPLDLNLPRDNGTRIRNGHLYLVTDETECSLVRPTEFTPPVGLMEGVAPEV